MMKMSTSIVNCEDWRSKLFGENLVKCNTIDETCEFQHISTEDTLNSQTRVNGSEEKCDEVEEVYGVYFSFANINAECDDFTKSLREFYRKFNEDDMAESKKIKFEVIQVVLWTHTDVIVDYEATFRKNVQDLPWFAVPFSDVETKRRLAQKYRIKVGAPALVLVKSGGVEISRPPRDLLDDPAGFPWTPRPLEEILAGVTLEKCGRWEEMEGSGDAKVTAPFTYADLPDDCVRAFYFAAHWCPPCKSFTPQLAETYSLIRRRGHDFQIIFVSSDRSQESYSRTTSSMPWLSVGWSQGSARRELAGALAVQGIPALRLITSKGATPIDARHHLSGDPDGLNFPWKPGPINILTERYLSKLQEHPALVLFIDGEDSELQFAESVLLPAAESYYDEYSILHPGFYPYQTSPDEETIDFEYTFSSASDKTHSSVSLNKRKNNYLQFLIAIDTEASDMLRDHMGLDDAVPLLTAIDFPKNRLAIMQYGAEITTDSVQNFLDNYLSGQVEFQTLRPFTEDVLRDD